MNKLLDEKFKEFLQNNQDAINNKLIKDVFYAGAHAACWEIAIATIEQRDGVSQRLHDEINEYVKQG